MTSKQRAFLRKQAQTLEPIFHVGKQDVTPELVKTIEEALEKRELIKISVLNNCASEPKDIAETIGGRARAEVVQVIGRKIVLYKQSTKNPVIELPKK